MADSKQSELAELIASLGAALMFAAAIFIWTNWEQVRSYVSHAAPAVENTLEKALHPGVSSQALMTEFQGAGGLESISSWRGFKVRSFKVSFNREGVLEGVHLTLDKTWPGHKLASMDNLKLALAADCGTQWKMLSFPDGTLSLVPSVDEAPAGVPAVCGAIQQGKKPDELALSMTAVKSVAAARPKSESEAQPAPSAGAQAFTAHDKPPVVTEQPQRAVPVRDFAAEAAAQASRDVTFLNKKSVSLDAAVVPSANANHPAYVSATAPWSNGFRTLLGNDYELYKDYLTVASPTVIDKEGGVFGDGMEQHSGGAHSGFFWMGKSGKLIAVLFDEDRKPRISVYGVASMAELPLTVAKQLSDYQQRR